MRTHTETHTDHGKVREPGGRAVTSPDFDLCGWNSQSPGPRCLLGSWKFTLSPSLSFQFLARSLSLPSGSSGDSLITREDGRRKRTGERGMGGGMGEGNLWCPDSGIFNPLCEGWASLLLCLALADQRGSSDPGEIARSLLLSWPDAHTCTHTFSAHKCCGAWHNWWGCRWWCW